MAFQCFSIMGKKGVLPGRAFQMRTTVSSGSPDASATMRQPETSHPLGGAPSLAKSSMTNWMWRSRANWSGLAWRWAAMGFLAGRRRRPAATSRRQLASDSGMASSRKWLSRSQCYHGASSSQRPSWRSVQCSR